MKDEVRKAVTVGACYTALHYHARLIARRQAAGHAPRPADVAAVIRLKGEIRILKSGGTP